jgi:hypothetical protein
MPDTDGVEWAHVEFLDPDDPDHEAGDVAWLDDERIGSGRDPARLPPPAAPGRALASLLALALFLAGVGGGAVAAYNRHLTGLRLADELVLQPTGSPPSIPGLAALGFAASWHQQVAEQVLVPVVNHSPRPVVLLDAVLREPGLVGAARLTPVTGRPLAPGESGELAGTVTADCTVASAAVAVGVLSLGGNMVTTVAASQLLVHARTSGGKSSTALVHPETASSDLQQRICGQEGNNLTGPVALDTAVDQKAHTVTVRLSTSSNADTAVDYMAEARFTIAPGLQLAGLSVSTPKAKNPEIGVLKPTAALALTYVIDVSKCPSALSPTLTELQLELQVLYSIHGVVLQVQGPTLSFDRLIAETCGLGAPS